MAVDATKLRVVHPSDLKKEFMARNDEGKTEEGVIKSSMANFGIFNYGATI